MPPPAARALPYRLAALVAAALLAVAFLALSAPPAEAHALLESTSPSDGQTVDTPPAEVVLQFAEPVTASFGAVRVYDGTGAQLATGDVDAVDGDPSRLRIPLPDEIADGTYVTTWAVTSADAHPIEGAFVFNVGAAAADQGAVEAIFARARAGDVPLALGASLLRAVVYAGTLLAAGGAAFLYWVHDRKAAERPALVRIAVVAAAVAVAGTVVGLAVQGALLSGRGLAGLVDPRLLGAVLGTSYGASALVRLAGLVVLLAGLPRLGRRAGLPLTAIGGLVALGSFALTGHTATTQPRWLVVAADLSHTLAAAAWFGGLVLLVVALRRRRADDDAVGGARLVARYSSLATVAVGLVSVAGLTLAWAQVRALRALTSTTYGWTLVAKVALVVVVLAVGAYNNQRLVPAIRRGAERAWPILSRTVRLEVAGLVVVLAITGVLTTIRPARSEAGVGEPFSQYVDLGEDYQVNLTVDPNVAGDNQMHIYLLGDDGRPADAASELTLGFTMPANDIAPIERTPSPVGPGHWTMSGPELSIPGPWLIRVDARVSEFELLSAEVPVTVNE